MNATMREPRSPGPWVDEDGCACGDSFADFHAGITFDEGVQAVRAAGGGFDAGGGYRSRGPVLWAMHVLRLDDWYREHSDHAWFLDDDEPAYTPSPEFGF